MPRLNDFDKLVAHGCKQRWCWRLYCTTCGNMEFRNGMELIGMGQDPLSDPGALHENGLKWHDHPEDLVARMVPLGCQVAAANVKEYYRQHDDIDWLGFMGLALWRIENTQVPITERVTGEPAAGNRELLLKLISNSWSSQFYELFHSCRNRGRSQSLGSENAFSRAMVCCKQIIRGQRPGFGIADLEIMEGAVIQLLERRRTQSSLT